MRRARLHQNWKTASVSCVQARVKEHPPGWCLELKYAAARMWHRESAARLHLLEEGSHREDGPQMRETIFASGSIDAYSAHALKNATEIERMEERTLPPTNIGTIRPLARRVLLLTVLAIVAALPCSAQSRTGFANRKSASLAVSPCVGSQLSVRHEAEDGAMGGQRGLYYSFKNNSQSPCTLKGSPAYVLLDRAGRMIQQTRSDDGGDVVTLAPGGKAFFSVSYHSCEFIKGATDRHRPCTYSAKARITAPGTRRAFILREVIDPEGRKIESISAVTGTLEELGIIIEKPKP